MFFKKSVLKNSQNSTENTCVEVRHICEIPIQVFSCELCKISNFYRTPPAAASWNMPTKNFKKITNIYSVDSEFSLQLSNSLLYISLANLKCTFTLRFHKTFLQEIFVSWNMICLPLQRNKKISRGSVLVLDLLISLTLFWAILPFLNPESSKNIFGFLLFSGSIKRKRCFPVFQKTLK